SVTSEGQVHSAAPYCPGSDVRISQLGGPKLQICILAGLASQTIWCSSASQRGELARSMNLASSSRSSAPALRPSGLDAAAASSSSESHHSSAMPSYSA